MHSVTTKPAPVASWQPGRGSGQGNGSVTGAHRDSSTSGAVALAVLKRGRWCILAKLVRSHPLDELVLAMPYRNRQTVNHVSLPPIALRYAREHGAQDWVVRLDTEGLCYALPLADVERCGWLKASDGQPEWFVPLATFRAIPWQNWPYVEDTVRLGQPEQAARQLALW